MHKRATSDVSTHSSLEFSHSDIENMISEINMAANPTPPADHTPQVEDAPGALLIPDTGDIVGDELKPESKTVTRKDPVFYCENIVLKVEDTLFCVPKSGLNETGTYFNTLFNQVVSTPAALKQGNSDDNPIVLDGVSKDHFQDFLKVIYRFRGVSKPSTDEQCLGILHLATEWNFPDIREAALIRLEHLFISPLGAPFDSTHDPIRALALCMKYKIRQHFVHQLELIITSITPLNRAGMSDAGIDGETISLITEMREQWLCGKVWGGYTHPMLIDGKLGLFPSRVAASRIIKDSLKRRSTLFGWVCHEPVEPCNEDQVNLEDEELRLRANVSCMQDQELRIVEDEDKRKRVAKEEEEKRAMEEADALLVAEMEEKRLQSTRCAVEQAERLRRYEDALAVVKEEKERRAREEQAREQEAQEAQRREILEKEAKREEKRRLKEESRKAKSTTEWGS